MTSLNKRDRMRQDLNDKLSLVLGLPARAWGLSSVASYKIRTKLDFSILLSLRYKQENLQVEILWKPEIIDLYFMMTID